MFIRTGVVAKCVPRRSDDTFAEDVVDVYHAEIVVIGVGDDELGDGILLHELVGVVGQFVGLDGFRVVAHDAGGGEEGGVGMMFHHAAKVPVGDDAEEVLVGVGNSHGTEAAAGDGEDEG